jgi:hypothetical protein
MPEVNSATSGVMSNSGRDCNTFNRSRAAFGVSCTSFVEDKLRDVDLEIMPTLSHQSRVICWWPAMIKSRLGLEVS